MKEGNKIANMWTIILILLSVVETAVLAIFGVDDLCLMGELLFIGGVFVVRFSYRLARFRNTWHSVFYKKSPNEGDNEPSEFAIIVTKVIGYIVMFMSILSFLVSAIFI